MTIPSQEQLDEWKRRFEKTQAEGKGAKRRAKPSTPKTPHNTPEVPDTVKDVVLGGESSHEYVKRVRRFGHNSTPAAEGDAEQLRLQKLKAKFSHAGPDGAHEGVAEPFDPNSDRAAFGRWLAENRLSEDIPDKPTGQQ